MKENSLACFLSILSQVALVAAFGCQPEKSATTEDADASAMPNIIFIMADDLGYADIEPYGQQIIQTPHLKRMAQEGIRFTQHYAGNTVCAPSRCALMTGKHMGHAQVRGNAQDTPHGQAPITDEAITVAELLQKVGYETALIGKWGLGIQGTSGDPLKQGFDSYYGYLDQVLAHNYYPEYLLRDGERETLRNKVVYQDSTAWHRGLGSHSEEQVDYSHDLFVEEALSFIGREREKPFFLYLPFTIPHDNGEAPDGYRMEVPDLGAYAEEDWDREARAYAAMITRMDTHIGQLLDKLKEQGLDENTLVMFTSDNGPMPTVDFTEFFDSNGPLKGGKRDLYEGGIRVPFIARWPGKIAPNQQSDHISAFWDFMPTVGQITGVEVPGDIDGISYLPTLLGDQNQPTHEYLYWEFPEQGYSVAARQGQWKAIRRNMKENPDGPIELYDLQIDLGEENNLADQHPKVVSQLTALLEQARSPSDRFPMPGETMANRQ